MHHWRTALLALVALPAPALADELRPQIQIDGGLSVIGPGYEHPITPHIALQVEAFVFGTYFLPWFDAGHDVKGVGAGIRPTWFLNAGGHGFYVSPYLRGVLVDETITGFDGRGFTTGFFAGWAFSLSDKLDLRLGAGVQYIHTNVDQLHTSTPFAAIDGVVGYRL